MADRYYGPGSGVKWHRTYVSADPTAVHAQRRYQVGDHVAYYDRKRKGYRSCKREAYIVCHDRLYYEGILYPARDDEHWLDWAGCDDGPVYVSGGESRYTIWLVDTGRSLKGVRIRQLKRWPGPLPEWY
jgi:hypothetical protein